MRLRTFAQISFREVLGLATADDFAGKAPVFIGHLFRLGGDDEHLQAVKAGDPHRGLCLKLHPAVGALHGSARGQHDHFFLLARHFRLGRRKQTFHGRMFEKPRVTRPHPSDHFVAPFLITEDRVPGWQANRASMWRIWEWHSQVLLLPCRIG